ncbi:MAG: glycoside hydrolase family 88 protein [Ignavibacteriae bacterium]|nr:glycoside hydrolase family 88 protein [Ignavibacteriota bacterium]
MFHRFLLFLAVTLIACNAQERVSRTAPWSFRLAQSFMTMQPDTMHHPEDKRTPKWEYEMGLVLEGFYQMWEHTKDSQYVAYIRKNLEAYIQPNGSIRTYKLDEFNIDKVAPGKVTLRMYQMLGDEKFKKAADTLRHQLSLHPRTKEGGFWHKKIYPSQMWLDGLYMGEPFYTLYANQYNEQSSYDDIAKQFLLIENNSRDPRTGLYFHGWDESRSQRWANPKTGTSPHLWGRSLGWFAMALVDVLEIFPENHHNQKDLLRIFSSLADDLLKPRDDSTKLWYQVIDRQGDEGNYTEASASTMLTYAFAKGARLGYLPKEYADRAAESFNGILDHLVTVDDQGLVHLHRVCSVAGLGGNPYRDGSYEYYIGEPQRADDFKGYGPFLLAAIELERLGKISTEGSNK